MPDSGLTLISGAIACLALLPACRPPPRPAPAGLSEASGVVRSGDLLLVVCDETPGGYFAYGIPEAALEPFESRALLSSLDSRPLARIEWRGAFAASDLESIDVLPDGRVVVLSEDAAALFDERGVVARYDRRLVDSGGRGLEGLAVLAAERGTSVVAVLWEGGYASPKAAGFRLPAGEDATPYPPALVIHELAAFERGRDVVFDGPAGPRGRLGRFVPLGVPGLPGEDAAGGAFRAPDLVWHRAPSGAVQLIVLLSSEDPDGNADRACQWLQRFDEEGRRIGEPLDLGAAIAETGGKARNWEGLAWFEEGRVLVLVADASGDSEVRACLVRVPDDW